MWYAHEGMGWWMLFGGVIWLLLIFTIAWIAVQLIHRNLGSRADSMEQIKRRYACGEITRDQFQQIARDLIDPVTGSGHGGRDSG